MKLGFYWKVILFLIFILILLGVFLNHHYFFRRVIIPELFVNTDQDGDGADDLHDILEGARAQVGITKFYQDAYYVGGYPPEETGVCTDVIWRSFKNAGFNFKEMIDQDIRQNIVHYPGVNGKPDPNIDFRRVKNLIPFFEEHAQNLTTEVRSWDPENLYQWQGGDIVIWDKSALIPRMHVAIISNLRRRDGVPYVIHNYGIGTQENDYLLKWPTPIIHHFRFPK